MFRKAAVTVLILLAATASAFAGGNRASSTSWIGLSPTGGAATIAPAAGSFVTLYEGTADTAQPFVHLRCYQGGSLVLEGWQAVFTTPSGSATFTLSSNGWQAGAASCAASLENWDLYTKNGKISTLATTSFDVSG